MVDSRTTIGLCVCLGGGDLGVHKCVAKCLATPTFADYTMLNQRITVDLPYSNHISNIFGGKVRPPPIWNPASGSGVTENVHVQTNLVYESVPQQLF